MKHVVVSKSGELLYMGNCAVAARAAASKSPEGAAWYRTTLQKRFIGTAPAESPEVPVTSPEVDGADTPEAVEPVQPTKDHAPSLALEPEPDLTVSQKKKK